MSRIAWAIVAAAGCFACTTSSIADAWDPPAGYYDTATGTGTTLKTQLTTIMSTGHIQRSYGDFRYASPLFDADPNNAGKILLVYNRASVPGAWDSGATWDREHVWPQSLQPGSASNSSKGNLGDHHALRPCTPSINGSRGNKPFGLYATTGNYGSLGTYWFPGDADKGDIARCLFYSATRWSSLGITLVNGTPGTNQMGDLASLIRWNYTDPPDEFERRRHHVIYSSALNPSYYTNNRNAYIDRPEFAWSVFGPGANDSTLYFGASAPANGASADTLDLGRVLLGGAVPAAQAVTLHKDGGDPTYFMVTLGGGATSTVTGRYNAFDYDPQDRNFNVGLAVSTAVAGVQTGTVTINNLDVTSGGTGQGSTDGDDVLTVSLAVLEHAQASFTSESQTAAMTAEFGVAPDSGVEDLIVEVFNYDYNADRALMDVDGVSVATYPFGFAGGVAGDIGAGSAALTFTFDTTGKASGVYTQPIDVDVSDEDLSGEATDQLDLTLSVRVVGDAGDWDDDGDVDLSDHDAFLDCLSGPGAATFSSGCEYAFDFDLDTDVDLDDYSHLSTVFTGP